MWVAINSSTGFTISALFVLMGEVCYSYSVDLKGCSVSSYKCANGKCVSKVNPECDGVKDCFDGSDELRCGK